MTLTEIISTSRQLAEAFHALISLNVTKRSLFDEVLMETVTNSRDIYGSWSVWEPNALDGKDHRYRDAPGHDATGRYLPFWNRGNGHLEVEPNTNYTDPSLGDYYLRPRTTGCERTTPRSVYYPVSGERMVFTTHVVPIFRNGLFAGVAGVDVLPSRVEHEVAADVCSLFERLSRREREVYHWIVEGKTNQEIGIILGISSHTVKHHVEKILHKTGMENRHSLAIAALQQSQDSLPMLLNLG